MKIGIVQINPVIGDFAYNCRKIQAGAEKCAEAGCRMAIFPELALCGYPPQDLLERESFLVDHDRALRELAGALPDIDVLLGALERCTEPRGKRLYNSALVLRDGKIVSRARKQLLPSYDVFDETRYFQPGTKSVVHVIDGMRFGLTVCEDIWSEEIQQYRKDPVRSFFENDDRVDVLINISASPFHQGKERLRRKIFQRLSKEYNCPVFYCNQVGGQDSLLFDGNSLVLDGEGNPVATANGFTEDFLVIDTRDWSGTAHGVPDMDPVAAVHDGLVMGIRDYVRKCGFSTVVLGLSGGVDSALTCALAVEALGPENVMGVAMPSVYSSRASLDDARELAENLGCRFEVVPIAPLVDAYKVSLSPLFGDLPEDLTEQNIQARIRGNLLMALSNKFGSLLLTTGNKSEMAVGYCTLYGDMSGGLAVISDVPKQLVYRLCRHINRDLVRIPVNILEKPPSAELKPDQTDQDDLPPYEVLDRILELYLEEGKGQDEIIAMGFDAGVVEDVVRRIRLNEYKRKQAPMGLKVTTKAFGFGRRYPNVQNYRG